MEATTNSSETEETSWQERYDELYPWQSSTSIAHFLGTNHEWVSRHAARLKVKPKLVESETKHPIRGFRKELILELKPILELIPLQGDLLSAQDISDRTGVERQRVQRMLQKAGIETQTRRHNTVRIPGEYYQPYAEDIVNEMKDNFPQLAGDWMTEAEIARVLGRDPEWVHTHTIPYMSVSEERIARNGHEHPHHPPEVVAQLTIESEADNLLPLATDQDIALRSLATSVKRGEKWVVERLPYTSSEASKKRKSVHGQMYTYVSPNPHDDLIDMPEDILSREPEAYRIERREWIEDELETLDGQKTTLNFVGLSLKVILAERQRRAEERDAFLEKERVFREEKVQLGVTIPVRNGDADKKPWQNSAACIQADPDVFFPDTDESPMAAKKVCARCNVSAQCLEHALEHNETIGIWGGLTARERKKLKQR